MNRIGRGEGDQVEHARDQHPPAEGRIASAFSKIRTLAAKITHKGGDTGRAKLAVTSVRHSFRKPEGGLNARNLAVVQQPPRGPVATKKEHAHDIPRGPNTAELGGEHTYVNVASRSGKSEPSALKKIREFAAKMANRGGDTRRGQFEVTSVRRSFRKPEGGLNAKHAQQPPRGEPEYDIPRSSNTAMSEGDHTYVNAASARKPGSEGPVYDMPRSSDTAMPGDHTYVNAASARKPESESHTYETVYNLTRGSINRSKERVRENVAASTNLNEPIYESIDELLSRAGQEYDSVPTEHIYESMDDILSRERESRTYDSVPMDSEYDSVPMEHIYESIDDVAVQEHIYETIDDFQGEGYYDELPGGDLRSAEPLYQNFPLNIAQEIALSPLGDLTEAGMGYMPTKGEIAEDLENGKFLFRPEHDYNDEINPQVVFENSGTKADGSAPRSILKQQDSTAAVSSPKPASIEASKLSESEMGRVPYLVDFFNQKAAASSAEPQSGNVKGVGTEGVENKGKGVRFADNKNEVIPIPKSGKSKRLNG